MQPSLELASALTASVATLREINNFIDKSKNNSKEVICPKDDSEKALSVFEPYKKEFAQFNPELVWEYSVLGNHYQILLFEGEETLTVSLCPNYYVPWALRNATHPREHDFVVIDGYVLTVAKVMEVIDEHLNSNSIREAIINRAIVKSQFERLTESERLLYEATEEQMQSEFDRWRAERGLFSVASYEEYLKANGLTHSVIERKIWDSKSYNNFLDSLSSISVEDYFSRHASEFTRYKMESYVASSEKEAEELNEFLKEHPDEMCVWARKTFLSGKENNAGGEMNTYQLNTAWQYQLDSEVTKVLLEKQSVGVLPPVEMNGKWMFINILSSSPPVFDQETESRIRQRLLNEWLDKKKQSSCIQWLWGDTDIFPNRNIQEQ